MSVVATAVEVAATGAKVAAKASSVLSWLPWAFAAVSLIGGAGGTLWYRMQWVDCVASVAIDAAKAEEKIRTQKDADAKFTRALAEQLQPVKDAIQEQANATSVALARVQSDPRCGGTAAARAFDGIVQPARVKAGAGAAGPAKP